MFIVKRFAVLGPRPLPAAVGAVQRDVFTAAPSPLDDDNGLASRALDPAVLCLTHYEAALHPHQERPTDVINKVFIPVALGVILVHPPDL